MAPGGRYAASEQATTIITGDSGDRREVRYLRRRLLPPVDAAPTLAEHLVVKGDRPDLLAATYFADPTLYWLICDANLLLHPDELTAADRLGTGVRVPLPTGVPYR